MNRVSTRLETLERDFRRAANARSTQNAVKELQETSKQRKQAFDQGDPMAKYPLPWEKSL